MTQKESTSPPTPTQVHLKNSQIFEIVGLKEKAKNLKSFQFTYGLIRNIKEFEKVTEALEQAADPPERIKEYREEKQNLVRKMAEKVGDQIKTEPLTEDQRRMGLREGTPVFKDPDKAEVELDKLYKKYEKDMVEYQNQVREANEEIMNGHSIVNIFWIKGEHVPKKDISMDILYTAWPLIDFTEEDLKDLEDKE